MALVPYNNNNQRQRRRDARALVPTTGKVPAQLKQFVKQAISTKLEPNVYDKYGSFALSPTLQPSVMNVIPVASREGECVNLDKMRFAFTIDDGSAATGYSGTTRVLVFEWKPLSIPTTADILEYTAAAQIANSPHRWTTRQSYRVLFDSKYQVAPGSVFGTNVVKEFKQKGQRKRFNDATVPAQAVGLCYYLAVSDDPSITQPLWNYSIRVHYTDA